MVLPIMVILVLLALVLALSFYRVLLIKKVVTNTRWLPLSTQIQTLKLALVLLLVATIKNAASSRSVGEEVLGATLSFGFKGVGIAANYQVQGVKDIPGDNSSLALNVTFSDFNIHYENLMEVGKLDKSSTTLGYTLVAAPRTTFWFELQNTDIHGVDSDVGRVTSSIFGRAVLKYDIL